MLQTWRPANLLKTDSNTGFSCFSYIAKFLRTPILKNIHEQLILDGQSFLSCLYRIRSSHPEVFWNKSALENFGKVKVKHLCPSLFFNKVAGLKSGTLLKRYPDASVSLWIFRNNYEPLFYRTPVVAASEWSHSCFRFLLKLFYFLFLFLQ